MVTEQLITAHPRLITPVHALVFGSALLVYNTQHIINWQRYVAGMRSKLKPWYFLFFNIGIILVAISLFWLSRQVLFACLILGLLSFAYSWPLLPFANRKRLREYGWLKILVLTGVWTTVTSVLPILCNHKNISDYPFEIMLRFVLMFTLCLLFDIRDMTTDMQNNIDTIPNKVGLRNAYRLINCTLVTFVLLSALQYVRYPLPQRLAGAFLTALCTRFVVTYLRKHPTHKGYLAYADGMMILYTLLVLLIPAP